LADPNLPDIQPTDFNPGDLYMARFNPRDVDSTNIDFDTEQKLKRFYCALIKPSFIEFDLDRLCVYSVKIFSNKVNQILLACQNIKVNKN